MQSLIDEANQSLEESGTPSHEIMVIVLHREFSAGTIGTTSPRAQTKSARRSR